MYLQFTNYRIHHNELFANKINHIIRIDSFWNQTKRHIRKFKGILRDLFHLFLKECHWRFNRGNPKEKLRQLNHGLTNN